MYHTEHEANISGFQCATIVRPAARKGEAKGFNYVKAFGYVVSLLLIVAAVF